LHFCFDGLPGSAFRAFEELTPANAGVDATPYNSIHAFKQTGIHVMLDQRHRALTASVNLTITRKWRGQRLLQDAERHKSRMNYPSRTACDQSWDKVNVKANMEGRDWTE
jgi:hypothetical protein